MERYATEFDFLIGRTVVGVNDTDGGLELRLDDNSTCCITSDRFGDGRVSLEWFDESGITFDPNTSEWYEAIIANCSYSDILGADYYIARQLETLVQFGMIHYGWVVNAESAAARWKSEQAQWKHKRAIEAARKLLEQER